MPIVSEKTKSKAAQLSYNCESKEAALKRVGEVLNCL